MTIVENGEHRIGLADSLRGMRRIKRFVSKNPVESTALAVQAGMATFLVGSLLTIAIDQIKHGEARDNVREVARQADAAALREDYKVTGGVDLQRLKSSYVVTLRRSGDLVSETILIDNAWSRIEAESGCLPVQTFLSPKSPGTYLIGIKC